MKTAEQGGTMTREELTARLAECEGFTPGEWKHLGRKVWSGFEFVADTSKEGWVSECKANARLIALAPALDRAKSIEDMAKSFGVEVGQGDTLHLVNLASALRSAWAEIDRMKLDLTKRDSNPLDAALNEGDGSYRP